MKHDESRHRDITERQSIAIDLLLLGLSVTTVAQQIGVSRQTVSNWIHSHIPFIVERNRRRRMNDEARARRCEHALDLAIELVIRSLESGETTLAHRIFQRNASQSLTGGESVGPTTPVGVSVKLASESSVDLEMEMLQRLEFTLLVEDQSRIAADRAE